MSTTTPIIHNSALVNVLHKVEDVAKGILHGAQDVFVKIFGQPAVDQFEASMKALLKEDVMTIITDAVTAADSLKLGGVPAAGVDKKAAAFNQISSDLEASGKSLSTNAINLGIEMVVGLLRAKAPAPAGS